MDEDTPTEVVQTFSCDQCTRKFKTPLGLQRHTGRCVTAVSKSQLGGKRQPGLIKVKGDQMLMVKKRRVTKNRERSTEKAAAALLELVTL